MHVDTEHGKPIKLWTDGVPVEQSALEQLYNVASMPFIHGWLAVMPDVHLGMGATIGSVIPTDGAIIPAAVGVDIGCGMCAVELNCSNDELLNVSLSLLRECIERRIPHGRTCNGGQGDVGAWSYRSEPVDVSDVWRHELSERYDFIVKDAPRLAKANARNHLGTLGSGNHFIEVCTSDTGNAWLVVHSGSRGIGGAIGSYYIKRAKELCKRWHVKLPDPNLAYLPDGEDDFSRYMVAANWAQKFAKLSRGLMADATMGALHDHGLCAEPRRTIDCHHNFVQHIRHGGKRVLLTRKGATDASAGTMGVIPGSMGDPTYIVRGKGNADSWNSCAHGAGRVMSRTQARKTFCVGDHKLATEGVECRKDESVLDETPYSYKRIGDVMAAQTDLVDTVARLKQVVCVKG